MEPSKSQVRKAGSTIRRYKRGEVSADAYYEALAVVSAYRSSFSYPLIKVNNGLRSFLSTLGIKAEVSQRLKRMDTIVDKITARESGLSLERMVDIGGCRVALDDDSIDDLRLLEDRIRSAWGDQLWEARCKDYIAEPRESGYRAVHLVVRRDGKSIEIQLRTRRMHAWAETMESLSQHFGQNFKQDGGHTPVDEFGRMLSKAVQVMDGTYQMTPAESEQLLYWRAQVDAMLNPTTFKEV